MSSAKETSDALNPPVVETAHVVVPARARTAGDYLALALATCGVGLIPLAPGGGRLSRASSHSELSTSGSLTPCEGSKVWAAASASWPTTCSQASTRRRSCRCWFRFKYFSEGDEMEETKDPNAHASEQAKGAGVPKRDAEATSSETLSDIEESEKVCGGSASGAESSSLESSSPKPDAGGEGRADGSDTGGPM